MTNNDEGEWLDAVLAVRLTAERSGEPLKNQILRRARDGLMRDRASRYIVTGPTSESNIGDLVGQERDGYFNLPMRFFWAGEEGRGLEADWITGDFSTSIDDDLWHCRAYRPVRGGSWIDEASSRNQCAASLRI